MLRHDIKAPVHGGRLRKARESDPTLDWIDLSTGLNPFAYPIPELSPDAFRRLPEVSAGLERCLTELCNQWSFCITAGTQTVIEHLPLLLPPTQICVANHSYAEHQFCWTKYGHEVTHTDLPSLPKDARIGVVVNPNNPTGEWLHLDHLDDMRKELIARDGFLVVDEAFVETQPERSALNLDDPEGLIVLRSFGKFFGLAGIRAGFVTGDTNLVQALQLSFGPWNVSGPALQIMELALQDTAWQIETRHRLMALSERLEVTLASQFPNRKRTDFFVYLQNVDVDAWDSVFKEHGIIIRTFPHHQAIRIGLPGTELEWNRVEAAVNG